MKLRTILEKLDGTWDRGGHGNPFFGVDRPSGITTGSKLANQYRGNGNGMKSPIDNDPDVERDIINSIADHLKWNYPKLIEKGQISLHILNMAIGQVLTGDKSTKIEVSTIIKALKKHKIKVR